MRGRVYAPDEECPWCRCEISLFSMVVDPSWGSYGVDIGAQENEEHDHVDNLCRGGGELLRVCEVKMRLL